MYVLNCDGKKINRMTLTGNFLKKGLRLQGNKAMTVEPAAIFSFSLWSRSEFSRRVAAHLSSHLKWENLRRWCGRYVFFNRRRRECDLQQKKGMRRSPQE